ncbi:hypothetical protein IAE35_23680 [Pseudomonas sp. S75]|uniref:hypothetical protein n=1 Tax=unclassified Pseudomonas TaxID=196821 RepID=UPI00190742DE|nr:MULTISPECIES: hypothetical protein [unclassified Pseudomonas]MBJ9978395.1 hypothetical protein [Pseudomonas sp. S30]MBK0156350.1 hypothetical protein [Pseudomonas sp. S75]
MNTFVAPLVMTFGLLALAGCDGTGDTPAKSAAIEAKGFSFDGRWTVAGVAVSDDGVQALVDDDPSLMNKTLTFSPESLKWDSEGGNSDTCSQPVINALTANPNEENSALLEKLGMHDTTSYSVHCETGSWGPVMGANPTFYTTQSGDLALVWYDGGLLKLKPQR